MNIRGPEVVRIFQFPDQYPYYSRKGTIKSEVHKNVGFFLQFKNFFKQDKIMKLHKMAIANKAKKRNPLKAEVEFCKLVKAVKQ